MDWTTWFMWSDFILKGGEVSYGKVLGVKSTIYIRVTLHWGYLIELWLYLLVRIVYSGCFNWLCNVYVSVCGGIWQLCWCLVICVPVFTVLCTVCAVFRYCFFHVYLFILICFVCTSVMTTANERKLNCSNYYYYYYYYYY